MLIAFVYGSPVMLDLRSVRMLIVGAVSGGYVLFEMKVSLCGPLCESRGMSWESNVFRTPFGLSHCSYICLEEGKLTPKSFQEENGYGKGGVYDEIFRGDWESYDPWESSCRLPVVSDLYNGAGACSMFRMFQGWLSMSTTSAGEGTLMVNPLLGKATAYFLLRPFFHPRKGPIEALGSGFLDFDNWSLEDETTSVLHGAVPSNCQELNTALHPHLGLQDTMTHVPQVRPGDYVAWHCDSKLSILQLKLLGALVIYWIAIHAVDKTHAGKDDSSVMYIPACPLTEANADYLVRQREAFFEGTSPPDGHETKISKLTDVTW